METWQIIVGVIIFGVLIFAVFFLGDGEDSKEELYDKIEDSNKRVKITTNNKTKSVEKPQDQKAALTQEQREEFRDKRRKEIETALKKFEGRKKGEVDNSLEAKFNYAGIETTVTNFAVFSVFVGILIAGIIFYLLSNEIIALVAGVVTGFFIPRIFINTLVKRRMSKFIELLPDALDVVVRSMKSGLPLTEAIKIIAREMPDPIGPEFLLITEGQSVGLSLAEAFERMYDRMPLAEVRFLSIVISIQASTGGNLGEILGNLSEVLRSRKRLKGKIKALSAEAKASAYIIGSLPFVISSLIHLMAPTYLLPLFNTSTGNIILGASAAWMSIGVYIMRQMIDFKY